MTRAQIWLRGSLALSLGIYLLSGFLEVGMGWQILWLVLAVGLATFQGGLRWGVILALLGFLDEYIFSGWTWPEIGFLLISLVLVIALGEGFRQSYRRQVWLSRQLGLLVAALEELSSCSNREEILRAIPSLLARRQIEHVSIWRKVGEEMELVAEGGLIEERTRVPASGILGRAWREGKSVYIPDVRREPSYIPSRTPRVRSELAIPLVERGELVAVLNLERSFPIPNREREGLEHFGRAVGRILDTLAERSEAFLLAQLAASMASAASPQGAAQRALAQLVPALGMRSGVLWYQRGSRLEALGFFGTFSGQVNEVLHRGLLYPQGLSWQVYLDQTPRFEEHYDQLPSALPPLREEGIRRAIVQPIPLEPAPRGRLLLNLYDNRLGPWPSRLKEQLAAVANMLGLGFTRAFAEGRLRLLLELAQAVGNPPEQIYPRLLSVALEIVPGVEQAELWLQGEAGWERWTLEGREQVSAEEAEELWWPGPPQLVEGKLYLPVSRHGEAFALLILKSPFDPGALGEDSMRVAQIFAPVLWLLLNEARYRKLLLRAALTDPLTGLGNRRAFNRDLSDELGRAQRYGYPLSLLVLDLRGFKQINDTLGHVAGDWALIQIARALELERRNGDSQYRWGGDEFAALLPHTSLEGAQAAARRYARAIEVIEVKGFPLGCSIGVAAFPQDASNMEDLLRLADSRMYEAKTRGLTLL